jgi:preprotein translocase subunit SecE
MAKSATVDRDAQPVKAADKLEKAANKSAGKLERQGGSGPRPENLITRTVDFLKDVRSEMRKVVTPSWDEVRSMTTVVILTVFAFAAFFYVVDGILGRVVQAMLHWLGGAR